MTARAGRRCPAPAPPLLRHEGAEPRADAVVHQGVRLVGRDHRRIVRQEPRLQAVAERQARREFRQPRHRGALPGRHVDRQRRRGQHQPVGPQQAARHRRGRDQAAQAVPEHHEASCCRCADTVGAPARGCGHRRPRRAGHGREVLAGEAALGAGTERQRRAVAVLVVGPHRPAAGVEPRRKRRVASGVLAQAVHDQHRAARRAFGSTAHRGPIEHREPVAVGGGQGSLCGHIGHPRVGIVMNDGL